MPSLALLWSVSTWFVSCKVCDTTEIINVCVTCYRNLCGNDTKKCKICKCDLCQECVMTCGQCGKGTCLECTSDVDGEKCKKCGPLVA